VADANPFAEIIDGHKLGVFVTDHDYTVVFANPAVCEFLGKSMDSIAGRPCHEVVRFRTSSGQLFCGPFCRVRRRLREGKTESKHLLTHRGRSGEENRFRVLTGALTPWGKKETVLMHLITRADSTGVAFDERAPQALERSVAVEHPNPAPGGSPAESPADEASRLVGAGGSVDLNLLTRREVEVLRLLAVGSGTKSIAEELFISPITVRHHIQSIMSKLDVHRRIEAVLIWLRSRERAIREPLRSPDR
jgi:DNA-binding CsgD family transcriptional regulator